MTWYAYTPLVWPVLASVVFVGAISAYLWRRRETAGALPLSLAGFLVALLCLLIAAQVATRDPLVLEVWFVVAGALMLPAAVLALWFALEYAGLRDRLTRPVVVVLVVPVVARMALLLVDVPLVLGGEPPLAGGLERALGPLGLVFGVFGMVVLLLATAVLIVLFVRSPAHRVPVALILVGHVGVRIAYALTAFGDAEPGRSLVAVLAFDALAALYAVALTRFRLFDLVPVARETIVERMPDPVLVLDRWGQLVELNPAAKRLLGTPRAEARGRHARDVLESFPQLLDAIAAPGAGSREVTVETSAGPRCLDVRTSPLGDWRGSPIGRLVALHDITALREAEASLVLHERALAAAREREHLARDLHDTTGQALAYAGMQSEAARRLLADGRAAEADATLQRLAAVARESHRELRGYILELNAGPSARQPLVESLRRYLDRFSEHYGIRGELRVADGFPAAELPGDDGVQVFRVVQEALANARRHAEAGAVRVALEGDGSCARFSVADDGRGFDVGALDGTGFGLRFMRERADELGGHLAVSSSPGQGTRVVLEVPADGSRAQPQAVDAEDGVTGQGPAAEAVPARWASP
jgi:PAS domain S-box-containing protein